MGIPIGVGQRYLFDWHQRFTRSGLQAFLRVKNYDESTPPTDYIEVGFAYAPTGTTEVGTTDIPILPPPGVLGISNRDIALFNGRLNFGSKKFIISHTFVRNQQIQVSIVDGYAVWRDRDGKKAVGIVYENRIYSIEGIDHKEIGGETIDWYLTCNFHENQQVI